MNVNKSVIVLIIVAAGLLLGVGFFAGIVYDNVIASALIPPTSTSTPAALDTDLIEQAYDVIDEEYVDQEAVTAEDLTYAAIAGMVDSLGDTGHSRFLTPEMLTAHNQDITGEFEGIGALVTVEGEHPVIVTPFDNSPAQKAGIQPGDIILEVDGFDTTGQPLSEVISRILGPAGTTVKLTLQNPETGETRTVTVTRAKIITPNVGWKMIPGTDIAHLRVSQFQSKTTEDLRFAIRSARQAGAKALILDLRNNPGGLLSEAIGVVSQFVSSGNALQIQDADGNVELVPVRRGGWATDFPLVVLINGGTASAAEITAGAIQDYARGELIGETTFGTGTVLNQFGLPDGSALLLATEQWLTSKGREIWHVGIEPDVQVELPPDVLIASPLNSEPLPDNWEEMEDTQLRQAVEMLISD